MKFVYQCVKHQPVMSYKRDLLLHQKKSRAAVILGWVIMVLAVLWMLIEYMQDEPVQVFEWIFAVAFFFNGLVTLMGGKGYSADRFFGKAFIRIDEKVIRVKSAIMAREQRIRWDDILYIRYRTNRYEIKLKDNTVKYLYLSKLHFFIVQEIKRVIDDLARKKGITSQ